MSNTIHSLILALQKAGIQMHNNGGKLSVSADKGVLTPQRQQQIRDNKAAILDWLSQFSPAQKHSPLVASEQHPVDLSFGQVRFWFMEQLEEDLSAYHIVSAIKLTGPLDQAIVAQSFDYIINRHESLRTSFHSEAGKPLAKLHQQVRCQLELEDISAMADAQAQQQHIAKAMSNAQLHHFDLAQPPLLALQLLKLNEQQTILIMTLHHIIADAWSLSILNSEFRQCYQRISAGQSPDLPALPVQYRDFVAWKQREMNDQMFDSQLAFWREELEHLAPVLPLPRDFARPQNMTFAGKTLMVQWPAQMAEQIKAFAQSQATTPYMVMLTAFQWLLYRYSGQHDIAVGTAVANRQDEQLEGLIGLFLNYLVMRNEVDPQGSFSRQLNTVKARAIKVFANQDIPFEQLVDKLELERSLNYLPLSQINFSYMNTLKGEVSLPGIKVEPVRHHNELAKFELSLNIGDDEQGMYCELEFNTALYREATIGAMLDDLTKMMQWVIEHPEMPLYHYGREGKKDLEIVPDHSTTLHQLFEHQVTQSPDAVAVALAYDQLSYAQLNVRANKIAAALLAAGVQPGHHVAIAMLRTPKLTAAILATLKVGATYVPLDLQYPTERLAMMINQSGVKVVIGDDDQPLPDGIGADIEQQLDAAAVIADERYSEANPAITVSADAAAYCIFTSGSTGVPKAISMPHHSLVNLMRWASEKVSIERSMLQFASTSFDVHCQEMFMTWYQGKKLMLIGAEQARNVVETLSYVSLHGVDTVMLPAPVLEQWGNSFSSSRDWFGGLKQLISTAQALHLTQPLINMFDNLVDCQLHDMYGPAETHVVTCKTYQRDSKDWHQNNSLGHPGDNTSCWVLDEYLSPVPTGVIGELYIGGVALAQGYLGAGDKTAEKFIPHPYSQLPGQRLYRTGDLVKRLANGEIKYIERSDHLIKFRGFRIEPGEIEHQLICLADIHQAVVVLKTDDSANQQLQAYVVTGQSHVTEVNIKQSLKSMLPAYMVPAHIFILDSLPLTSNGKVDTEVLLQMEVVVAEALDLPQGPGEEVMLTLWQELLEHENIGINDDFFFVGGHSLLATQLVNIVNENLAIEMPLQVIFEFSTIRTLVEHLGELMGSKEVFESVCEEYLKLQNMTPAELAALEQSL